MSCNEIKTNFYTQNETEENFIDNLCGSSTNKDEIPLNFSSINDTITYDNNGNYDLTSLYPNVCWSYASSNTSYSCVNDEEVEENEDKINKNKQINKKYNCVSEKKYEVHKEKNLENNTESALKLVTKTLKSVYTNILSEDMNITYFTCFTCDKRFYDLNNFEKHRSLHKKLRCSFCYLTFKHKKSMLRHCETFHVPKIEVVICNICETFIHAFDVVKHAEVHNGECNSYCYSCQTDFYSTIDTINHFCTFRSRQNQTKYECDMCKNNYCSFKALNSHKRNHPKCNSMFLCDVCGEIFDNLIIFKSHLFAHN